MSLKRARAELQAGGYGLSDDWLREEDQGEIDAAAAEFRRFLLGKYTDGSFTAADTCLLAYYHTQSGGRGAEDFALAPDQASTHGSQHLKTSIRHPTRVASDLIREELRSMNLLASSSPSTKAVAEFLASDHELGDKYANHPVTQEALNEGFSHEQIQPISVYFDGVQYTKNENFLGYCFLVILPIYLRVPDFLIYANVAAGGGALSGRCLKLFGRMFLQSIRIYAWLSLIIRQIGQPSWKWLGYEPGATTSTAVLVAVATNRSLMRLSLHWASRKEVVWSQANRYLMWVWNLTMTMLSDKHLKAKAAETHGLLAFVCEMLIKYEGVLSSTGSTEDQLFFQLLKHAGNAAMAFDDVMAQHGRQISETVAEQMLMHYNRFIVLCNRAGLPLLPKAHLMFHCIQR
ncbi:PIF1, partial [Symbiodinium sp. CCMP2456]